HRARPADRERGHDDGRAAAVLPAARGQSAGSPERESSRPDRAQEWCGNRLSAGTVRTGRIGTVGGAVSGDGGGSGTRELGEGQRGGNRGCVARSRATG